MSAERPILFSAPMVRAILAGAKTQTRRVVKPAPGRQAAWLTPALLNSSPRAEVASASGANGAQFEHPRGGPLTWVRCPYGVAGDDLWVRESAYIAPPDFGDRDLCNATDSDGRRRVVGYAASMDSDSVRCADDYGVKLTPSIHMPRWASRITLRVTSVRVERLRAISEDDAAAEGAPRVLALDEEHGRDERGHRIGFEALWREINGDALWDASPWVWVVGFERVQP